MDFQKMVNMKREANANDNAFAVPQISSKKPTDSDEGGTTYYGNDIGIEDDTDMYDDYDEIENNSSVTKLLSYFQNDIRNIEISMLEPYHNHTFFVNLTDDFKESINRMGILEPLLIAQSTNYGKYEVISGHRRLEAAKAVGLTSLPCRVAKDDASREILDEVMVITNLQRRNTFTKMELARSIKLLNDSRKKQGYRTDIISGEKSSTKQELAEEFGISVKKLYILMSFTQLSDYFANRVDNNELPEKVAYCLSFLSSFEQHLVEEYMKVNLDFVLTYDKAERLKEKKEKEKNLDKRTIETILSTGKTKRHSKLTTIKLSNELCEKYGIKGKTELEIINIIEKALMRYYENSPEIE